MRFQRSWTVLTDTVPGHMIQTNAVQCSSIVLLELAHIPMVKRECVFSQCALRSVVNGFLGFFWLS